MSFVEKILKEASEKGENAYAEKLLIAGNYSFYAIGALAIVLLITYVAAFGTSLTYTKSEWGAFGDYLGGILNPAVGLVTVYLVLINARLQRQELKNSIAEMKNSNDMLEKQNQAIEVQSFQNIFFNWLGSYKQAIDSIQFRSAVNPSFQPTGVAALTSIYQHNLYGPEMDRAFAKFDIVGTEFEMLMNLPLNCEDALTKRAEIAILEQWRMTKNSNNLADKLKSLFELLTWIDGQTSLIPTKNKYECYRIIRSQLSTAELVFIFYESWKLNSGLKGILTKYEILKDLPFADDPSTRIMFNRPNSIFFKATNVDSK